MKGVKIAKILFEEYKNRKGIFKNLLPPEYSLPKNVKIGSKEHLLFITLHVAIDYRKDAEKLWKSAKDLFENQNTRWIYNPEKVNSNYNKLIDCFEANFKIANFVDIAIWYRICRTIAEEFESDPTNILKINNYDAIKIIQFLQNRKNKKKFPFLSGPKISSLWIRMLNEVAKIKMKNLKEVSIPVDVHIARATYRLGLINGKFIKLNNETRRKVISLWRNICSNIDIYPLQLDEPLWLLSRNGCSNAKTNKKCPLFKECPVKEFCKYSG